MPQASGVAEPRCSRAGAKILHLSALLNSGLASFSDRISLCDGKDCPDNLQGSSYQKSLSQWLQPKSQAQTPLAKKGHELVPEPVTMTLDWTFLVVEEASHILNWDSQSERVFILCLMKPTYTGNFLITAKFWNLLLWTFSNTFKSREMIKWTPRFLSPSFNIFWLAPSPTPSFGGLFQNKSQILCHFNHWYFNNTHSWNKNCTHPYSLDGLPWWLRW